jgi:hypothetical protein
LEIWPTYALYEIASRIVTLIKSSRSVATLWFNPAKLWFHFTATVGVFQAA